MALALALARVDFHEPRDYGARTSMATNRAALRQRAREVVERAIGKLLPEDRVTVLEDALYQAEQMVRRQTVRRRTAVSVVPVSEAKADDVPRVRLNGGAASGQTTEKLQRAPIVLDGDDRPAWMDVVEYCEAHPSADGTFDVAEVGRAVWPDKPAAASRAHLYVVVKRKSPQSDRGRPRDPRFELLSPQRFRLLPVADEATLNL